MTTVLYTVVTCLRWWRTGPRGIAGLIFPAISELGVGQPEKFLYQCGFAFGGIFMGAGIWLYALLVYPMLYDACTATPDGPHKVEELSLLSRILKWGYLAAFGVILQGVLTLETTVTLQCVLHWVGAMCFMLGGLNHARVADQLYEILQHRAFAREFATNRNVRESRRFFANSWVRLVTKFRHLIITYASLFLFAIPILSQISSAMMGSSSSPATEPAGETFAEAAADEVTAASGRNMPADLTTMNMMGMMQWGIILQFAIYFLTYAVDLCMAACMVTER